MSHTIPYMWGEMAANKLKEWDMLISPVQALNWLMENEGICFSEEDQPDFFDGVKSVMDIDND